MLEAVGVQKEELTSMIVRFGRARVLLLILSCDGDVCMSVGEEYYTEYASRLVIVLTFCTLGWSPDVGGRPS